MSNALVVTANDAVNSVVAYENMCRWIAESESLAECKDIADKTAALKEFARRIRDTAAERRAANVRLIAERRYGELLKALARAEPEQRSPGRPVNMSGVGTNFQTARPEPSPYARALVETGTSRQQAHRLQALADVPQAVFDDAIKDPGVIPSRSGVIAAAKKAVQQVRDPQPKMPDDSLDLWGMLRRLERDGFFSKHPDALLSPMTESMQADMRRLVPLAVDFFTHFDEVLHEPA